MVRNHATEWAGLATAVINRISDSEGGSISRAADAAAASIGAGHAAFLFGSGHSVIPVEEIYPRYGGIVGFMPMLELPLSFFTQIVGNMGFSQFDYLENSAAYGKAIIDSYVIHREDCLIAFTHSGSTPVTLEIAIRFREKGGKVIGVTSLSRSRGSSSKHPSGKALHDVADIVIDTGVPEADVAINVSGNMVGPLSSVGAVTVANMISVATAEKLAESGKEVLANPVRAFDTDGQEKMRRIMHSYGELYSRHIALR